MLSLSMAYDCIFCMLHSGELPSFKVYDDGEFAAFLDLFPSHHAQVHISPKEHYTSKFSDAHPEVLGRLIQAAQKLAQLIEDRIPDVERCIIVIEGLEVDHLHVKIFPALEPNPVEYAITEPGDQATQELLQDLHQLLTDDEQPSTQG